MRLLAYEDCGDCITGMVETEDAYRAFATWKDGRLSFDHSYPKKDYSDLEHFQGVMGKFDPYVFFLKEPLEIDLPTFDAVKKLIRK